MNLTPMMVSRGIRGHLTSDCIRRCPNWFLRSHGLILCIYLPNVNCNQCDIDTQLVCLSAKSYPLTRSATARTSTRLLGTTLCMSHQEQCATCVEQRLSLQTLYRNRKSFLDFLCRGHYPRGNNFKHMLSGATANCAWL